jgi:hypothetical protein
MSVRTHISFLNANDPEFVESTSTPEKLKEWEEWNYRVSERPGAEIPDTDGIVQDTEEEYGGWLIAVKDIPKEATHIVVYRS